MLAVCSLGRDNPLKYFRGDDVCHAGGLTRMRDVLREIGHHPNYGKPHVPVAGVYDGRPVKSCLYCGRDLK